MVVSSRYRRIISPLLRLSTTSATSPSKSVFSFYFPLFFFSNYISTLFQLLILSMFTFRRIRSQLVLAWFLLTVFSPPDQNFKNSWSPREFLGESCLYGQGRHPVLRLLFIDLKKKNVDYFSFLDRWSWSYVGSFYRLLVVTLKNIITNWGDL